MIAIFLFFDRSNGICSKLSFGHDLKHCSVVTYDGKGWIMTTHDRDGLQSRTMSIKDADSFISKVKTMMPEIVAIISVFVNKRKYHRWFPLSINSCNEISRRISGIDIPITFNVYHLFKSLFKFDKKRNYKIDYAWGKI